MIFDEQNDSFESSKFVFHFFPSRGIDNVTRQSKNGVITIILFITLFEYMLVYFFD